MEKEKTMILMDFENVCEINENILNQETEVIIFWRDKENKRLKKYKEKIKEKVKKVIIYQLNINMGNQRNLLDDIIKYYLMKKMKEIRGERVIIYSNDKGFDVFVKILKICEKIKIERRGNLDKKNSGGKINKLYGDKKRDEII